MIDVLVVSLCALSGPFSILLAPLAAARWWLLRERRTALLAAILAVGAVTQTAVLMAAAGASRPSVPLGATPGYLSRIVGGRVVASALLGERAVEALARHAPGVKWILASFLAVAGALTLRALLRGPLGLKLLVCFGLLVLAVSLAKPTAAFDRPQWPVLWQWGGGTRYWLIPMVAFLAVLAFNVRSDAPRPARRMAAALLLLFPLGAALDFRHSPRPDLGFDEQVKRFESSPPGTRFAFRILPPGWEMVLTR